MLAVLICTVLGGKRRAQDGVAGVSWYHGTSASQLQNTLRGGTPFRRVSEKEYPGTACTEFCYSPCSDVEEKGKDVYMECGACSASDYKCRPGEPGFPEYYCDTHGPEASSCCELDGRDEQ